MESKNNAPVADARKLAKEFWKEKFDEYPQTDAEKLAVAMMQEYAAQLHPVADDMVSKKEYEHAVNTIGQLREQLKEAEVYINNLSKGYEH